ncbi:hypothetical protein, partial [Mesorhizobium sp. f-mel]
MILEEFNATQAAKLRGDWSALPSPLCEAFAQNLIGDSVVLVTTGDSRMVDCVLGQLSLADGLAVSDETIFDLVAKEI